MPSLSATARGNHPGQALYPMVSVGVVLEPLDDELASSFEAPHATSVISEPASASAAIRRIQRPGVPISDRVCPTVHSCWFGCDATSAPGANVGTQCFRLVSSSRT